MVIFNNIKYLNRLWNFLVYNLFHSMKKITDKDIFSKPEFEKAEKYSERITVKAIVKNDKNEFAFVTNSIHKCILLPGGGAESNNLEKEINRECEEEIFCSIKNIKKFLEVKEYRNRKAKKYHTICFYGEADKKILDDRRTEKEKEKGLKVIWLPKEKAMNLMEKQIKRLEKGEIKFYNTSFNIYRDYYFFKEFFEK